MDTGLPLPNSLQAEPSPTPGSFCISPHCRRTSPSPQFAAEALVAAAPVGTRSASAMAMGPRAPVFP
uniref:Predicted protein n=1 Tax=Hordeum vulgare subsp. vulgare TaxID=112509 RepID=F2DUV5_HORVV|nr:predicted protein [Hordeum vulgare subsp. vulgare]